MYCESAFRRIKFADLRQGDVLVDVRHMACVVDVDQPIDLGRDNLAMVGVTAFTPAGRRIGDAHEEMVALVADLDTVRLVAVRDRPRWRPDPQIATVDHLMARVGPIDPTSTAPMHEE